MENNSDRIKSGLNSLHQFVGEKGTPVAMRFDSGLPSVQRILTSVRMGDTTIDLDYKLVSLPLYLIERLPGLKLSG